MTPDPVFRRRARYRGTHPRTFDEKYKERDPLRYPETHAHVLASGKTPAGSHVPILVPEILAILSPAPGEIAVDATLGYGGHAEALLPRLRPGGRLIGMDVDRAALVRTETRLRALLDEPDPGGPFVVRRMNFAGLPRLLAELSLPGVDMVLADLGVSSMQLDDPSRGFSHKREGQLDLRMNPERGSPASAALAALGESRLAVILEENADEPHAKAIAAAVVRQSRQAPILTTTALAAAVRAGLSTLKPPVLEKDADASVARVFQALRIHVNEEDTALATFLRRLPECLNPGGRAVILTFHSGEDRRVKKAFSSARKAGVYSRISDVVIRAGAGERRANPRSTAAKLRWAVKA
jgi:16S rRNA (cytosine1402-N4)-methyltransferase